MPFPIEAGVFGIVRIIGLSLPKLCSKYFIVLPAAIEIISVSFCIRIVLQDTYATRYVQHSYVHTVQYSNLVGIVSY